MMKPDWSESELKTTASSELPESEDVWLLIVFWGIINDRDVRC